ncbi:hypothetical protein RJT34_13957 [Clitoria ternatea]|uniref:Uncharacterized protein n=1 Tax=Clitoria ternatea TaxID=43366 RepID=A0AAN9JS36_CLITE
MDLVEDTRRSDFSILQYLLCVTKPEENRRIQDDGSQTARNWLVFKAFTESTKFLSHYSRPLKGDDRTSKENTSLCLEVRMKASKLLKVKQYLQQALTASTEACSMTEAANKAFEDPW